MLVGNSLVDGCGKAFAALEDLDSSNLRLIVGPERDCGCVELGEPKFQSISLSILAVSRLQFCHLHDSLLSLLVLHAMLLPSSVSLNHSHVL